MITKNQDILPERKLDRYTDIRKESILQILNSLLQRNVLLPDNLNTVVDLGSYQGSSSKALIDIGAKKILSVDHNEIALNIGTHNGYIQSSFHGDMSEYVINHLPNNFEGLISAFNCILYLPTKNIWQLLSVIEKKLAENSQFIFTFSKSQIQWKDQLDSHFSRQSSLSSAQYFEGLNNGELDYNCFVLTKKNPLKQAYALRTRITTGRRG